MIDSQTIRHFFPYLQDTLTIQVKNPNPGKRRIATDNSASSQVSRPTLEAFLQAVFDYANVHRGQYKASQNTTRAYEMAHNVWANFINAQQWNEIILVENTTEAINTIMGCLYEEFRDGDNVVISRLEHSSNHAPWTGLQSRLAAREHPVNVDVRFVNFGLRTGELDMDHLARLVDKRTKIVSITGASNFLGIKPDITKIADIAHSTRYTHPNGKKGSYFLVDGAQLVPSTAVDVQRIGCDFFVWSAHKMTMPIGIGGLYGRRDIMESLTPMMYGGGAFLDVKENEMKFREAPWKFTAGTSNLIGTIASAEGVMFLVNLGLGNIVRQDEIVTKVRVEAVGKQIVTQKLLNTPRGNMPWKYEVPEKYTSEWTQYQAIHPELRKTFDPKYRMQNVRAAVNVAMNSIGRYVTDLTQQAINGLLEIPGVTVYGPRDASKRTSLVAFTVKGMSSPEVGENLDRIAGVETRCGHHCAYLAHDAYGIKYNGGTVRLSFYVYNTSEEINTALATIRKISRRAGNYRAK